MVWSAEIKNGIVGGLTVGSDTVKHIMVGGLMVVQQRSKTAL